MIENEKAQMVEAREEYFPARMIFDTEVTFWQFDEYLKMVQQENYKGIVQEDQLVIDMLNQGGFLTPTESQPYEINNIEVVFYDKTEYIHVRGDAVLVDVPPQQPIDPEILLSRTMYPPS